MRVVSGPPVIGANSDPSAFRPSSNSSTRATLRRGWDGRRGRVFDQAVTGLALPIATIMLDTNSKEPHTSRRQAQSERPPLRPSARGVGNLYVQKYPCYRRHTTLPRRPGPACFQRQWRSPAASSGPQLGAHFSREEGEESAKLILSGKIFCGI